MAITLADFTKIWASTSPLTPYSFTESNYKEGWNFVGSTPPSRQMWDSIQNQNDEKLKYIVDNFLPTTGGTMTGAIVGNPLTLTADDGNGNSTDLVLNSNGDLAWNGKNLDHVVDYSVFKTAQQFTQPTITSNRIKDVGGGYKRVGNVVYIYMRFRLNTTLTKGGWGVAENFPAPYNMGFSEDYRIPLIASAWYGDAYSGNVSSAFMDSSGIMRLITNDQMESTTTSNYYIHVYGNYYTE